MSPCLIPRCGCSWEGGGRQELRELGGSAQAHQGEWMSQQQLAQSAFAGQAQLLGRQGQGSRGDRKPGSGRAGPLGLPWSRCSEHRLVELGGLTAVCRPLPVCRGLEVQGAGADFPAPPHGADTGPVPAPLVGCILAHPHVLPQQCTHLHLTSSPMPRASSACSTLTSMEDQEPSTPLSQA